MSVIAARRVTLQDFPFEISGSQTKQVLVARSVLLVDDDDDVLTALQQFLTDAGFAVHTARNGREALALLDQIEPGVILLDLMMPVMDGKQFLVERNRLPGLARIPLVIMSAWTRDWNGDALGVDAVVTKPINPEKLVALVERYCDRDNARETARR
jgi:DNA-binding response OmpR family regulator